MIVDPSSRLDDDDADDPPHVGVIVWRDPSLLQVWLDRLDDDRPTND